MLTNLPEIFCINALMLPSFQYKLWLFSISECKDTLLCLHTNQKTFTKLYGMVTQRNNFTKRFLGFTQVFYFTIPPGTFKEAWGLWSMESLSSLNQMTWTQKTESQPSGDLNPKQRAVSVGTCHGRHTLTGKEFPSAFCYNHTSRGKGNGFSLKTIAVIFLLQVIKVV